LIPGTDTPGRGLDVRTSRVVDAGAKLRADLAALADSRIFFGHQSVGVNILDGVRDLASAEGAPFQIEEVVNASAVPPRGIAHMFVPENGDPLRKLESFRKALSSGAGKPIQIALLKFCYVDFKPDTDARALFARYQETMRRVQIENPGTTLVHVTVPLTTLQSGPKALVKRLLGRPVYGLVENARRDEYNALLRAAYEGREPIFDLALLEATAPDGRRRTTELNGRAVPVLVAEYTDDGEHLNANGRARAAREFLTVLASVSKRSAVAPARTP
jgi:hypothetical protein